MKKIFVLGAVLLAAMAVSCQKNEFIEENTTKDAFVTKPLTVTCTFAGADTKVDINSATGKTGWEAGDEVLFHGKWAGVDGSTYFSRIVELKSTDISEDKKSFTVTIDEINSCDDDKWKENSRYSNLYMAYPASAVNVDNGAKSWYAKTYFTSSNLPLVIGFNDLDNPGQFTVYNLCSIISFKITGDYDGYIFRGKNEEKVGYDSYYSEVAIRYESGGNSFKDGWVNGTPVTEISGSVVNDGTTENYICIPSGAHFTNGFEIILTKGEDRVKAVSTSKDVDLTRAGSSDSYKCKFMALGDISEKVHDYVPDAPPATDHYNNSAIPVGSAIALDASESANCYIIDAAGSYKFKAVKGDSPTALNTIASVALLWETHNTNEEIASANTVIKAIDYDYQSGGTPYIVFETPATLQTGNALIAAKDDHNDIIWSWHIWIPSTTITNIDAGFAATNAIMDRNLGALVVTPTDGDLSSQGLYYQWGRKDPLCGTKIKGYPSSAMKVYVSGQATNIEKSIQEPTTFYYVESSDWLASGGSDNLWNISGEKTIYDPCPPGYKVPGYDSSKDMWNMSGAKFGAEGNWTYVENKYCTFNDAESMFPLCGYLNGTGQSESGYGKRSLVWSSKQYDSNRANSMFIREGSYYAEKQSKSSGANVRCMVESAPAPVSIVIDGSFTDWSTVEGASTPSSVCKELKVVNDNDNFYIYISCEPGARGDELWGDEAGYYYFDFDLDNNPETGDFEEGSNGKFEAYMYLFVFGGTSESPLIKLNPNGSAKGMTIDGIVAKGTITGELIEIEMSVPRANLPAVDANQFVRLLSWRSKGGSKISNTFKVK